jgi:hypothetical protein
VTDEENGTANYFYNADTDDTRPFCRNGIENDEIMDAALKFRMIRNYMKVAMLLAL